MATNRTIIINSDQRLIEADNAILEEYKGRKWVKMVLYFGRDRTAEQNALIHSMYERISESRNDQTSVEVRSECKLLIGVPILRNGNEVYRKLWDATFGKLSYEQQLYLMGPNEMYGPTGYNVTSVMNRKQLSEYVETIISTYGDVNFSDLLSDG